MDRHLAQPVTGAHLDCMAHQLGRGVVLVRSNAKTRDDLGLAGLPHSYSRRRYSIYALDRAGVGRETALAIWQRRQLRAGCPDVGGGIVRAWGANSYQTLVRE